MLFRLLLVVVSLSFFACGLPKNRPVDKFIWDQQLANYLPGQTDENGMVDLAGFLAEMEKFPWRDQAILADRIQVVSPTLSVSDLKTDESFFIASALDASEEVGYFLGYIYPSKAVETDGFVVDMYEVTDMAFVRSLVTLFFERKGEELRKQLGDRAIYLNTTSDISWAEYLKEKQEYF